MSCFLLLLMTSQSVSVQNMFSMETNEDMVFYITVGIFVLCRTEKLHIVKLLILHNMDANIKYITSS